MTSQESNIRQNIELFVMLLERILETYCFCTDFSCCIILLHCEFTGGGDKGHS